MHRHRFVLLALSLLAAPAFAANDEELAKQLQNPVAHLISVPIQANWDVDMGVDGQGWRFTMNVQPVIPIGLTKEWNLISRTILPIIHQEHVVGDGTQSGTGDILQSLFISPTAAGPFGIIWGVGPAFSLPTASDDVLGSEKWGAGPTAVLLQQKHGFTYGILANHIWSFAGTDRRADVSATFLQPFFTYTTKTATTVGINSESTYDWEGSAWTIPLNAFVSQLARIGPQVLSLTAGGRYYADSPTGGPDYGFRFVVTFLFPEG